jgi:hypothetical protein
MSQIRIVLDRPAFQPGESVGGRVEWSDADLERSVSLRISLLWFTEGKGTEDTETLELHELQLPATTGSERFSLRLPAFPWSFSGHLISLIYAVEASLEPKGDVALERLTCAPGGQEVRL